MVFFFFENVFQVEDVEDEGWCKLRSWTKIIFWKSKLITMLVIFEMINNRANSIIQSSFITKIFFSIMHLLFEIANSRKCPSYVAQRHIHIWPMIYAMEPSETVRSYLDLVNHHLLGTCQRSNLNWSWIKWKISLVALMEWIYETFWYRLLLSKVKKKRVIVLECILCRFVISKKKKKLNEKFNRNNHYSSKESF